MDIRRFTQFQYLVLFGAAISLPFLYLVTRAFGWGIAAKGLYLPTALIIGFLYLRFIDPADPDTTNVLPFSTNNLSKLVITVLTVHIVITLFTPYAYFSLVVTLCLCYILVLLQFFRTSPRSVLYQVIILFTIPLITIVLTSELYFGHNDLLYDFLRIRNLLASGTPSAIQGGYALVPGLHVLTGVLKLVSAMHIRTSLYIAGISTYAIVLLTVYRIAQFWVNRWTACSIVLVLSVLSTFSFYSLYFFPQSLAFALVLFFVFTQFLADRGQIASTRLLFVGAVIAAALILTHHLTFVLFIPVFLLLYLSRTALEFNYEVVDTDARWILVGAAWMSAVTYWIFAEFSFISKFAVALKGILTIGATGKRGITSVYQYGNIPSGGPFAWLFSPLGLYYTLLMVLFICGLAYVIVYHTEYRRIGPILVTGIIGAALLLRTPISIRGLSRIAMVWLPFFAFIPGIGAYHLLRNNGSRIQRGLVIGLVVSLCVVGPIAGNANYFSSNERDVRVSFDSESYQEMRQVSLFTQLHVPHNEDGADMSSSWITTLTLRYFGVELPHRITPSQDGLQVGTSTFVYRNDWAEHKTTYKVTAGVNHQETAYFSNSWLDAAAQSNDRIYDSGETGILLIRAGDISPEPSDAESE